MCQDLFFPHGRQTDSMLGVGPTQQRTGEAAKGKAVTLAGRWARSGPEVGEGPLERAPKPGSEGSAGQPPAAGRRQQRRPDLSATLLSESHGSFCQRPSSARNEQGA